MEGWENSDKSLLKSLTRQIFPNTIRKNLVKEYPMETLRMPEDDINHNGDDRIYETKLLLAGCNCQRCHYYKFYLGDNKNWCKNKEEKPSSNICVDYETNITDPQTYIFRIEYETNK